ncbi:MAG: hypothetical protein JW862_01930 [Anaerolineales bacterium]|nr:hypothetical protein [Anaerolineales bacterium]
MSQATPAPEVRIAEDEKLTAVMIYTEHGIITGKVVSKQAIRVSTWLKTDMVPHFIQLLEAQTLLLGSSAGPHNAKFPELFVHIDQIIGIHLVPPSSEPLDYDPKEPHRKMVPTIGRVGFFQFDGLTRMSEQTDLPAYLGATKGEFAPLYDARMSCPILPAIKGIHADYVLLRQRATLFGLK